MIYKSCDFEKNPQKKNLSSNSGRYVPDTNFVELLDPSPMKVHCYTVQYLLVLRKNYPVFSQLELRMHAVLSRKRQSSLKRAENIKFDMLAYSDDNVNTSNQNGVDLFFSVTMTSSLLFTNGKNNLLK